MARREEQTGSGGPNLAWQQGGYHMQDSPCEHAVPINEQNDTGYLPVSPDSRDRGNPFDDGAVDEDLRKQRSRSVEAHDSTFWIGPGQAPEDAVIQREPRDKGKGRNTSALKALLCIGAALVLMVVGTMIFMHLRYTIRQIRVEGNSECSDQEVIAASGISVGMNMLTVDREKVEKNLAANSSLLRLISVKWDDSGTLVLTVRERHRASYITCNGIICILDNHGMVLQENVQIANLQDGEPDPLEGLVRVEGFSVRYYRKGRVLELYNQKQMDAYWDAMLEIQVMSLTDVVEVLYVTDTDNLYLATRDGFSVRLGDSEDMHAKLRAMQLTVRWLQENGKAGGTVDVSNPVEPTWIPEGTG
ncbi:MAG: FtsQ-type POTRA domain-containing protein [Clostridia bacterium]|nr:FtsQ-type POTRA domain-containing protein [Clostridia bacterium]